MKETKDMRSRVEDLESRRQYSLGMGGPEAIAKQHAKGKMTARERIDFMLDPGTFQEYGLLASHRGHQPGDKVTPADACITGLGHIDGRGAIIFAEDNTVFGGSYDWISLEKEMRMMDLAVQERVPMVTIYDGGGARAQMAAYAPEGIVSLKPFLKLTKLSGTVPTVGLVMGPAAGGPPIFACSLDFIIMVKHTGVMVIGGPPVVKQTMGIDVTKEELGSYEVHCAISGVADNPAENDKDAMLMAKRYLSYFPTNAWEYPPRVETDDDPNRMDEELLDILPSNPRATYDMKRIINCIVDKDSFFEIKPLYALNLITGLARMNGHTVGIIANQTMVLAGTVTASGARKERHFIDLCNAFHIPLIFLVDTPGVLIGPESEREGTPRIAADVTYSIARADVPKIAVGIRKTFGAGGGVMCCGADAEHTYVVGWPTLDPGGLPIEPGIMAAHGAELAAAKDPEALMAQLLEKYQQFTGPYPAAGIFNIDDVIDPRETRPRIIRALDLAMGRRIAQPSPVTRQGIRP